MNEYASSTMQKIAAEFPIEQREAVLTAMGKLLVRLDDHDLTVMATEKRRRREKAMNALIASDSDLE